MSSRSVFSNDIKARSGRRLQHVGQRADELVDVLLLDDQRRREGDRVAGGSDQHATLPALEEDVEGTLARLFDEQRGGKAIRFPELRAVLTYVTPSPVSRDVQLAELRGAGTRLRALAGELDANMKTQSSPKFVELLQEQAAAVMEFADGLG